MKKIFALALAALMTAGMTTVAFADKGDVNFINVDTKVYAIVDANDDNTFNSQKETVDASTTGVISLDTEGGKKIAIPVYGKNGTPITEKDDLKGWKIKAEWKVGEIEGKPEFEFVKIDNKYQYAVTFVLPEGAEVKDTDLAGSITIYDKSSDLKEAELKVNKVEFGTAYGYNQDILENVEDDLKDAEIVVFKDALEGGEGLEGEYTMCLGDIFEFTVDVTGQGKLNLKNNQDFNKEFAAMYDYANIDFLTFEMEPTFNKIGTAYIYADEDAYIYEVTADGAKEIKGLTWDEDYEAWTFKTRTLGAYAISDVELDETTVTEDGSSSTTDGGKENPDTGR